MFGAAQEVSMKTKVRAARVLIQSVRAMTVGSGVGLVEYGAESRIPSRLGPPCPVRSAYTPRL